MDTSGISTHDRIVGSLIGGAIGDALGYQCEFTRGIKEREYDTFEDDYGIFSDDTQMMLFTANAYLWRETRGMLRGIAMQPVDAIYFAYRDWYGTQNELPPAERNVSWIDKIPALRHRRDPGFTCLNALSLPEDQKGTVEKPINQSKGCGCTMRVAPVGLYQHYDKLSDVIQDAGASSALTHGHPLAIISTAFLGGLIHEICYDTARSFAEQLHLAAQFTNQYATLHFHRQYQDDFTKIMRKAFELSRNNRRDIENISELGEGWVAEEAVAIAIYCCLRHPDDFADAVIASVNHDGDSDSTGVIVGNIMGARLGINAIPEYYRNHIELKEFLTDFAEDFATGCPENVETLPESDPWIIKYVHHKAAKEYQ